MEWMETNITVDYGKTFELRDNCELDGTLEALIIK